jgi:glycosyltransferase involved in cell wall biosynthesis
MKRQHDGPSEDQGGVEVVLFWKQVEHRLSGRRYERLAAALSRHPGVRRVIVMTPPSPSAECGVGSRWLKALPLRWEKSPNGYVQLSLIRPSSLLGFTKGWSTDDRWLEWCVKTWFRFGPRRSRILWVAPDHPWADRLERLMRYDVLVSDCVDEMPAPGDEQYSTFERVVAISDRVLTTSPLTAAKLEALNPTSAYLANGVDAALLADPAEIRPQRQTTRRIGYVGVISARTDVRLLHKIAVRCPDAQLVLVGWVDPDREAEVEPLRQLPNVTFTGRLPFEEVPAQIDQFDVCLIPHLNNTLMRSQSALKLYQYLARGKAVVTTPINGTEGLQGVVHVARGHDEFIARVRQALDADVDDREAIRKRLMCARENTWDARVSAVWRGLAPQMSRA